MINLKRIFINAGILCLSWTLASATFADQSEFKLLTKSKSYGGGKIYAPAKINGNQFNMLLDTGASATYILPAKWNKDMPIVGVRIANGINGIPSRCDKLDLSKLSLVSTNNTNLTTPNFSGLRCRDNNGDNILGINFLYGKSIDLDYKSHKILISDLITSDVSFTDFITMSGGDGILGLPIQIGKDRTIGIFDTGAEICAVDIKFVEKHKNEFELIKNNSYGTEASGNRVLSKLYKIKRISITNEKYAANIYAIAYDFSGIQKVFGDNASLVLGHNLLSKFNWHIDLRQRNNAKWKITD